MATLSKKLGYLALYELPALFWLYQIISVHRKIHSSQSLFYTIFMVLVVLLPFFLMAKHRLFGFRTISLEKGNSDCDHPPLQKRDPDIEIDSSAKAKKTYAIVLTLSAAIMASYLFVASVVSLLMAIKIRPYPHWLLAIIFFVVGCVGVKWMRNGIRLWRAESRAARGLCPACGYPTVGNIVHICPECGRDLQLDTDGI